MRKARQESEQMIQTTAAARKEVETVKESKKSQKLCGSITKQYEITWAHTEYGIQKIRLNLYANPQVQNGIEYETDLYREQSSNGLLVRNMPVSKASIKRLEGRVSRKMTVEKKNWNEIEGK